MPPVKKPTTAAQKKAAAAKKAAEAKALAVVEETPSAITSPFESGSSRGLEEMDIEDITLPYLKCLQKTSKIADKDNEQFIEGMETGMMVNSLTNYVYPKQMRFVPIKFKKSRKKWAGDLKTIDCGSTGHKFPDMGAKYKDQCKYCEFAQFGNDNEKPSCSEFFTFISWITNDDIPQENRLIAISMTSTNMKTAKDMLKLARFRGKDLWANQFEFSTVKEKSNDNIFYKYKHKIVGEPESSEMKFFEGIYEFIESSTVIFHEDSDISEVAEKTNEEEIPF